MFRTLSPGIQVIVFIFMVYFMAGIGSLVYSMSLNLVVDQQILETADSSDPRVILSTTLFFHVFAFLVSFLVMLRFLGIRVEQLIYIDRIHLRPFVLTLGIFIIGMLATPLLDMINEPLKYALPGELVDGEQAQNELNNQLIYQKDPVQFIFTLIIMAGLPAFCEELVFRGFLMRKMIESGLSAGVTILLSAAIFSLTHFQPLKFLPIFFFGLCLGYVYYRFKNIKYAMILHFLVNASQIIAGFLIANEIVIWPF